MEFTEFREGEKMNKEEFIKKITEIPGIGKAKAELLYDNGFDSVDKIRKATVEDLIAVKGISKALAEKIKSEFKEEKAEKEEKKEELPKETREEKKTEREIEEEETEEETEEKKYTPKKKPKLSEEKKRTLILRAKKKRPEFLRQEWFRYKRLSKVWRRPKGLQSKYRKNLKYRPPLVRVGFRVPKEARGLHPSGFEEILVHRVEELDGINPDYQAIRIGATVGTRKRIQIKNRADELGIRILNRGEL